MANQKDVKRKIKAVNNIKKVTEAMETISSIRLQKAVRSLMAARSHSGELFSFISTIIKPFCEYGSEHILKNVYLANQRPVKNVLFLAISSDRGLCGFFNSRLMNHVTEAARMERHGGKNVSVIAVGKKASDILGRRKIDVISKYPMADSLQPSFAGRITSQCVDLFTAKKIDDVFIFYNHFISAGKQEVSALQFLPVLVEKACERKHIPIRDTAIFEESAERAYLLPDYIFEPDRWKILNALILHYLETMVHQALLESIASEHASRMIAMQQSTINADEMIKNLTVLYNKVRQALITRELIEVVGSAEALK